MRVDVRIVASTNRDLARAVAAGQFRADLFYRLAVFPIDVPPLRARRADIVPLAEQFVRAQARRLGKALVGLDEAARERLMASDWPGNVRELANVIERAAIVARRPRIAAPDLFVTSTSGGRGDQATVGASPAAPDGASAPADGDDERLASIERAHVLRILQRTGWAIEGKGGAASVLGLAPSTLRSRMAQLGIRRPAKRSPRDR
jgi:transcriptional regulator with GAF, ATPase, and Fis domain